MTIHGFVSGRVQGVGFRRFIQKRAAPLGIAGWTRNLRDGRVEFLAQGSDEAVESLLKQIREGNAFSNVKDVETRQIDPVVVVDFEIHPDEE